MRFCKYCGAKLEDRQECTCAEALAAAKTEESEEKSVELNKEIIADFSELAAETPDSSVSGDGTADEKPADKPVELKKDVTEDFSEVPSETSETNVSGDAASADKPVEAAGETAADKGGDVKKDKAEVAASATAPAKNAALPVPANTLSDDMLKRGLVLVCALALGLVLFITVMGNVVGSGYKQPVKNVVKGINKERAELVLKSFYPRDYMEELRDRAEDSDNDWDDVTDDMDSLISDVKEVCEDSYFGDDLAVSAKIVKKKKATAKDLRMLKKEFEDYDAVVKKAYKLKVRLTVKGDDEKEQVHFYIYSVKLKGGKWVLYPDDKTKGTISEKYSEVFKDMNKELESIFSDYSRSLDILLPE